MKTYDTMPDKIVNPLTGGTLEKTKKARVPNTQRVASNVDLIKHKYVAYYRGPGLKDNDPDEEMFIPVKDKH